MAQFKHEDFIYEIRAGGDLIRTFSNESAATTYALAVVMQSHENIGAVTLHLVCLLPGYGSECLRDFGCPSRQKPLF